jgi:hypothetical protein
MTTIQMQGLGTTGQWGNQVFQYAFVRTYAKRHGIRYEVPTWAGQAFFDLNDPPVSRPLPGRREQYGPSRHEERFGNPIPPADTEYHNKNFIGWAQYHTSWHAPDKPFIQDLFTATPEVTAQHNPLISNLRQHGTTIVSVHIRRGDSGRLIYFFVPITWYLQWLKDNWSRFESPVLYFAIEDLEHKKWFAKYSPVTMDDLGVELQPVPHKGYRYPYDTGSHRARQLTFFPDWYVLQNSDVVVGSESTFSASAAWTSRVNREYWRPRLSLQGFEQCDPWNMDVSPREHLDDFPGIPGTQIDSNPAFQEYWKGFKTTHPSVPETDSMIQSWIDAHERNYA